MPNTLVQVTQNGVTTTVTARTVTLVQVGAGSGSEWTVVSKTSNYTANSGEVVEVSASGGAVTITVPVTSGARVIVKKTDASSNAVTISPASGHIDGAGSVALTEQFQSRLTIGNGTDANLDAERKPYGSPTALGGPASDGTSGLVPRSDHVHGTLVSRNVQTSNYTLVLTDANNKVIEFNKSTAGTVTIPPASSVAWVDGTVIEVYAMGAGQVTITAGAGVTLRAPNGAKSAHQYATVGLRYRGSDEWIVSGDTTT